MSRFVAGDLALIVRGTTSSDLQDESVDDFHYLVPQTMVRIDREVDQHGGSSRADWGAYYVVSPVTNTPDCWVNQDDAGDQYVYDIHLGPVSVPKTLDEIETFLATP